MSYGSITNPLPAAQDDSIDGTPDEKTSLIVGNSTPFPNQETSSLWSKLVFGWMAILMRLGNRKKKLDPEDLDLFPLPHDCSTDHLSDLFEKAWKKELASSSPSLSRALFRAFGYDFVIGGFCLKLIHDSALFVGPQVLHCPVEYG